MSEYRVHLPWSYWDGTVETELRVDSYPYGGGVDGSGVQITLGQRRDGQIIAVRLPSESARRLAHAILGGPEYEPPADSCTCTIVGPDPACPVHQGRKARGPRPPYLGPGCICDGSGRTCPRHGVVL